MSQTLELQGGQDAIIDWLIEHDLDPLDYRCTVTLDDDGTVTLRRYVRDADGQIIIGDPHACPTCGRGEPEQPLTEDVVVTPKRPFPALF